MAPGVPALMTSASPAEALLQPAPTRSAARPRRSRRWSCCPASRCATWSRPAARAPPARCGTSGRARRWRSGGTAGGAPTGSSKGERPPAHVLGVQVVQDRRRVGRAAPRRRPRVRPASPAPPPTSTRRPPARGVHGARASEQQPRTAAAPARSGATAHRQRRATSSPAATPLRSSQDSSARPASAAATRPPSSAPAADQIAERARRLDGSAPPATSPPGQRLHGRASRAQVQVAQRPAIAPSTRATTSRAVAAAHVQRAADARPAAWPVRGGRRLGPPVGGEVAAPCRSAAARRC